MSYTAFASLVTLALFVGMVLLLEVGRRIGVHRMANDPKGAQSGTGAVDGAVFAPVSYTHLDVYKRQALP